MTDDHRRTEQQQRRAMYLGAYMGGFLTFGLLILALALRGQPII